MQICCVNSALRAAALGLVEVDEMDGSTQMYSAEQLFVRELSRPTTSASSPIIALISRTR
jgi:hypothetical protein